MTDELELAESAEVLAYQAKELNWFLNHDAVKKAFMSTVDRISKEWEKATDEKSREAAWYKLQAFKTLQQELRAHAVRKPHLTVEG